ncbi:MAG: alpha-ketoacid dehydrogenase subunit beta [Chloroflexi bacterium]|nr:alpha-ketoacid dehydrogenase subunit beta [Chloroflexota bacterium]
MVTSKPSSARQTVLDSLNRGLHQAFAEDGRVYLIGEDLLDPYGGAFKVSKGLSSKYPERVWTSPVSEAAIVGVAAGMALRGLRPVAEIMFGDFTTLIADQVINSLSKFRSMYNDQVEVPLVIRTPMGGRRGYGPTHSQTLEKLFLGMPGLRTLAANTLADPGDMLHKAIVEDPGPVLFIENKLLYLKPVLDREALKDFEVEIHNRKDSYATTHTLRLKGASPPVITLTAYGYMAELAREALLRLAFEHEIFCELVVPSQLAPFSADGALELSLQQSLERSQRLLAIEEGNYTLGWGAEVFARAVQAFPGQLKAAQRVAAADMPIPASAPLEDKTLPGVDDIIAVARRMV